MRPSAWPARGWKPNPPRTPKSAAGKRGISCRALAGFGYYPRREGFCLEFAGGASVGGKPLANGSITFVPVDNEGNVAGDHGPGGGTSIEKGKYRVDKGLTVGRYRVEIQGTRKILNKKVITTLGAGLHNPEVASVP